jgi:hypothetical protein
MIEPARKRAIAFIDGQNLFNHAKAAFGYSYPNYDVLSLAQAVCVSNGWNLMQCRFYTGIPDAIEDPSRHSFWVNKTAQMGRAGVEVTTRPVRYRNKTIRLADGSIYTFPVGEEKGIDVRIALDVLTGAINDRYDVAIIFSQDQDLSEVALEIRTISKQQNRWIKIACAFPISPTASNRRGINNTDWVRIDRIMYQQCIDPKDYRR